MKFAKFDSEAARSRDDKATNERGYHSVCFSMPDPNDSGRLTFTIRVLPPWYEQVADVGTYCQAAYRDHLGDGFLLGPALTDTIERDGCVLCEAISSLLKVPTSIGRTSSRGAVYGSADIRAGPSNDLLENDIQDFRGHLSVGDFLDSEPLPRSMGDCDFYIAEARPWWSLNRSVAPSALPYDPEERALCGAHLRSWVRDNLDLGEQPKINVVMRRVESGDTIEVTRFDVLTMSDREEKVKVHLLEVAFVVSFASGEQSGCRQCFERRVK